MTDFSDVHAEEAVLSHMLFHNRQSKRLTAEHFTGADRRAIFTALQEGAPFETIERLDFELPGYASDLFFAPYTAPHYLREAVEELIRLEELRRLERRVLDWQRRARTMTVFRARSELAQCLR